MLYNLNLGLSRSSGFRLLSGVELDDMSAIKRVQIFKFTIMMKSLLIDTNAAIMKKKIKIPDYAGFFA